MSLPSISANIIAGMELKFPDDEEKKNSVCHVLKAPQMPQDFFTNFQTEGLTSKASIESLCFRFERQRRSSGLYHMRFFDMLKVMLYMSTGAEPYKKQIENASRRENRVVTSTLLLSLIH